MGRRRTPTFTAMEDQLISSGLQPDRHTLKRLLWESAVNVAFWNGTVRRKVPAALAFNGGNGALRISGLSQQQKSDGTRLLWAGQGDNVQYWSGVGGPTLIDTNLTYVESSTATQRATMWDFVQYGDWTIYNASYPAEPAHILKPPAADAVFAAGQAPVGVTKFLKFMSFVMALGYGPRGTRVGWSDANNIELWIAAADNTAGSLGIDEFDTPIRSGARLGDSLAVYAEDQMALVRYTGAPFIFGQKTVIDGIGAVGKAAVASDLKMNAGVGRGGVWATDGVTSRYIDEGFLSTYLQENVTWAQAAKIVAVRNDQTGCFEFHFPMRGSVTVNEAWSWDPRTGGWSPCPPMAYGDERRLFDHILYGAGDGKVLLGDFDPTAAADLVLETKPLVMSTSESPHVVTRVDEVDILLHQANNLEFRLGCCDEPNGDWEWTDYMGASAGARVYEIPELPEQPYWKFGMRNTPGQANWTLDLQGFLLYGVPTGTKTP